MWFSFSSWRRSSPGARAAKHKLPEADINMLASIRFRGEQPKTVERWEYIYSAIRGSRWLDEQAE
jgi:hypothetical protein